MITLWTYKKLGEDLRDKAVQPSHQFIYLYLFAVSGLYAAKRDDLYALSAGLVVALVLIGYFYKVNSKGDGQDFITRFICLSIPVSLRTLSLSVVLSVITTTIMELISGLPAGTYLKAKLGLIFGPDSALRIPEPQQVLTADQEQAITMALIIIVSFAIFYFIGIMIKGLKIASTPLPLVDKAQTQEKTGDGAV